MQSMITPPSEFSSSVLSTAQVVLRAQANALTYLADLYDGDEQTRSQFLTALELMHNSQLNRGKIVLSGMGKSFKICHKISATMNSLGIHATTLHPSEALHGDLGIIQPMDVLVAISASGESPELQQMFSHAPSELAIVCLTCSMRQTSLTQRAQALVTAHVPEAFTEETSFGLKAPTTTTTCCLAIGDALSITLAEMLEPDLNKRRMAFLRSHPGGAIGASSRISHRQQQRQQPQLPVRSPPTPPLAPTDAAPDAASTACS